MINRQDEIILIDDVLYSHFVLIDSDTKEVNGEGKYIISKNELLNLLETNPELAKCDSRLEIFLNDSDKSNLKPTSDNILNVLLGVE
jgi:hypothetical protein